MEHYTLWNVEELYWRAPGAGPTTMSLFSAAEWNNARLVAECLRGNEQAWNALVDRYKNLILFHPDSFRHAAPGCRRYFPGRLPGSVQRTAPPARRGRAAGLADPRDDPQVLPLEAPAAPRRSDWNDSEVEQHLADQPIPPDMLAELEREQMVREAMATLPGPLPPDDRAAVLRTPAAALHGGRGAAETGARLDRLHPRTLPQAAQEESSRRKGF